MLPHDSTMEIESKDVFLCKHQRDINCLSDPNRSIRKRALIQMSTLVETSSTIPITFFADHLQQPLLDCFIDPVEKCRELAICIYMIGIRKKWILCDTILKSIVTLGVVRVGTVPYEEKAEEIRLHFLQCLLLVIQNVKDVDVLNLCMEELVTITSKSALDAFPEVKKINAEIITALSVKCPSSMKLYSGNVIRPLVANLGHQHSKVRSMTMVAIGRVILCGSEALVKMMEDPLLPALKKLVQDRSASVRKELVAVLHSWFTDLEDIKEVETPLFALWLALLSDATAEVQHDAVTAINDVGDQWENDAVLRLETQMPTDDDENDEMALPFGAEDTSFGDYACPFSPFQTRPHRGIRAMARRLFASVLPSLLLDVGDWTAQARTQSTLSLKMLIVFAEDIININLEKITTALSKTCRDDEPDVVQAVKECVNVIGRFSESETLFAVLVPLAMGTNAGQDTPSHRCNGLVLLSLSIQGMSQEKACQHMDIITSGLCDPGLLEAELPELLEYLVNAIGAVIDTAGAQLDVYDTGAFRCFWVLNQLLASTPPGSVAHASAELYLTRLVNVRRESSLSELYQTFLPQLLKTLNAPCDVKEPCWDKSSPRRALFDTLCRRGGIACGQNMDIIVPILVCHMGITREPTLRLAFLAQLESMLQDDSMCKFFRDHAQTVIVECIVPNMTWRAGRVASTVRKVAMACIYTLLRQAVPDKRILFTVAPAMLPVLKCCLEDEDAKTRQLVCLALQYLFKALPNTMSAEPVNQLYPEILKRLDDSNDLVRKAGCATFIEFLKASDKENFMGTPIDYSLDCLFVHLDDQERDIQEAVFQVIIATIDINPQLVYKKATENRSRHRSPGYCDKLMELTKET